MYKKNKIFILLMLVFCGSLYSQSFKTLMLKESEIFNFFQKMSSGYSDTKYSFKVEKTYNFILDFLSKSSYSHVLPASLFEEINEDYSKNWSKSKMLYFAIGAPVDCSYDSGKQTLFLGDEHEFSLFRDYLSQKNCVPFILNRVYKPVVKTLKDTSLVKINEFVFFVNIMNSEEAFNKIFSDGVFKIKKKFESQNDAQLLLQNCQMVLGVRLPGKDNLIIREDSIEENIFQKTHYNIYHLGVPCFVKRVILFNNLENNIIFDVNIE